MKILVVEDNEDSRNLLVKQLCAYGHEVTAVADGAEALKQALAQPPDVIVSDILMPKMDGYQLCRECKLNEQLKNIPFVFYTATYTLDEDRKFALSLGAETFIVKPTEPDSLVQTLCEIFEKAKSGALAPAEVAPLEPSVYLTEYSKRIFAKLEDKVAQLEAEITERRRAEEALQIAEQNFRNSLDNSPLGIRIVTAEGELLYANQAILDIYGYGSVEELKAMPAKQRYTPESYAEHQKRKERRKLGKPVPSSYEISIVRKDGEVRHLIASRKEVVWGGETRYQAIYQDITERKQAEEKLKESESFLNDIIEQSPFSTYISDDEGTNIRQNQACRELFGIEGDEEVIGKYNMFKDEEAKRQGFMPLIEEVFSKGKTVNLVIDYDFQKVKHVKVPKATHKLLDVTIFPIKDANGKVTNAVVQHKDITERKQAEDEIKRAAEEWRTTFDSITDLVFITDKDYKLVRVNKAFADVFKMKPMELIGKPCYEILHGTNEPVPNCPYKKTLKTKKPATSEFFEPQLGIYLEVMTSPIFDDKGEVVASVHVTRDITERKKMEEQLIVTDRLASIGELASGIAHELNNPLTSVIGFSELLLDKDVSEDVKEDLRVVNREAQRTASVVRNLLTFARKHAPTKELVAINNLIQKVLELRTYEQKVNNIEVNTRFAPDLPEITADGFQLQQVFLNLIINAEHFMTEAYRRGTLTITTERVGDIIRASFADDGPGIAKENLGHVFDPFFTTKEVGKGTGLGLSIAYGIITEHSGRIYAESKLGKGATFVVELPISK